MHRNNLTFVFSIFIIVIILPGLSIAQVSPDDDDIQFNWRYRAGDTITALTAGKINGESAVVVAANNIVYVLDSDGTVVANYTIQAQGKIYAAFIGDVDDDGKDEILLGTGWTQKDEINLNKMYPPPDGIPEEEDLLYMVLRSKGGLYVIDDGEVLQWTDVDQWVRSIHLTDINGDGENETVIVSGGYLKKYFKKYTDIIYKHRFCWIEWDVDSLPNSESECTCDICFWDNESERCYENKTWEECGWDNITDKGWNLSEVPSANTSIVIYDKTQGLLSKTDASEIDAVFLNADVLDTYFSDQELILGSEDNVYVLNYTGSVKTNYTIPGEIKYVYSFDAGNNMGEGILFSFINSSSGTYCIKAISRQGNVLWLYPLASDSDITAIYAKRDTAGIDEILFISEGMLYVVNNRGQLEWSYMFKYDELNLIKINKLFSIDLDDDCLDNFLIVSNKMLYNYELVGTFIKRQSADKYLTLGRESYDKNRYLEAKDYLESALQLYTEASYPAGVSDCESMLHDISLKLAGDRQVDAKSKYAKALTYYSMQDYESSKEYIIAAREIYEELNDSKSIVMCDTLMETIDEIIAKRDTTTTVPILITSTTQFTESDTSFQLNDIVSLLSDNALVSILLVMLLAVSMLSIRHHMRHKLHKSQKKKKPTEVKLADKLKDTPLTDESDEKERMDNWRTIKENLDKLDKL